MNAIQQLTAIADSIPRVTTAHAYLTLNLIAKEQLIGRYSIGEQLGLSNSTVRTLFKHLKKSNLIEEKRKRGHTLTQSGQFTLDKLNQHIVKESPLTTTQLTVGMINYGTQIRGAKRKLTNGLIERDTALLAGAKGATSLQYQNGRLIIPGLELQEQTMYETDFQTLLSIFKLKEGDILIVSSADNTPLARVGAIAVAFHLLTP